MKGQTKVFWTVIGTIIAIVSLTVILLLYMNILGGIKDKKALAACESSVASWSASKNIEGSTFDMKINCPTINRTLSDSTKSKQRIAQDIADCWTGFGQGRRLTKDNSGFLDDANSMCHICTVYIFNEDIDGLLEYMQTTKPKGSATYLVNLVGTDIGYETSFIDKFEQGKYSVVFYQGKDVSKNPQFPSKGVFFAAGKYITNELPRPFVISAKEGIIQFKLYDLEDANTLSYIILMPYTNSMLSDIKCKSVLI